MRLEWYTTAFNRKILNWSTSWARLLRLSFDLGVYITLLLLPAALIYLLYLVGSKLVHTVDPARPAEDRVRAGPELEILIPGVTLPTNELGFYVVTLLVCTVIHELGHALASYVEDVPLNGFGVRVLFILPMAYADLSTEALDRLKSWGKLRIFCAGVWHNLFLGLCSYLLFVGHARLVSPFYSMNSGVYVKSLDTDSPLTGPRGLRAHDVILQINGVAVSNLASYHHALVKALRDKPKYCITSEYVHLNDESKKIATVNGLVECCDPSALEYICYEHFIVNGVLEMPPFMCLHVRKLIEASGGACDDQDNCNPGYYCVKPLLDNRTTILQIRRSSGTNVLYLGHPGDIYRTVKSSGYVPRTKVFSAQLAEQSLLLLKYMTVFSFGLAFVNVLPCYGFDGQYIVGVLVQWLFSGVIRKRRSRRLISTIITGVGTALLVVLVVDFLRQSLVKGVG